jgi:RNA polymerase sigma factor (sigma-70 family)
MIKNVSNDELVFLVRQRIEHAFIVLQQRMEIKQDRLIKKVLIQNRYCGLDFCDLKIVAMQALFNAIDSYNGKKTVFDAYYHLLLERELVNEMRRFNSRNHTYLNTAISLDEAMPEGGNLYDVIAHEDEKNKWSSYINDLVDEDKLNLTPQQKTILVYRSLGYSYSEIGKILNKNYRQISRIITMIANKKKKLDQLY